ncbi:hypothetical protein [Paraburkholderia dinghuensis]|uniref:hypothetical protein n=1 Tax=Paraburkholderia dinghuensis TaxID=2305225 RepID=UPI001C88E16C|nr:hypothetical protein [Paraburkholderia dinghuensis]
MRTPSERKSASRHLRLRWRSPAVVAVVTLMGGIVAADPAAAQSAGDWPMAGQNLRNTRSAATERAIGLDNVAKLTPRWSLDTDGGRRRCLFSGPRRHDMGGGCR